MASETIKRVRLDEVCEMNMGQSPDSKSYNQEERGLPFYQGNADFGVLHPSPRYWCDSPTKVADKDDILISVRAPIGALNIADSKCCIGRGLAALRPKACCDLWYLYFFLKSRVGELNAKGTGSTFKAINKKNLAETSVSLPPLPAQRRIATTLDKISEMKRNAEARLQKLDLLVKARFNEMFGDPMTNPKGWQSTTLSNHIEFLTSGSRGWAKYYSESGEYFITIKNVKDTRISVDDVQHICPPEGAEAERTRVQEGDLLISITADLGRTGIVTKAIASHGAYINQHLTCIRLKRDKVLPLFVAYYMESSAGKVQFQSKNQSAVKAGLNFAAIRSLGFYLPPLSLQREFAAFVEKVEALKAMAQASLDRVDLLYRAKLQEYFG